MAKSGGLGMALLSGAVNALVSVTLAAAEAGIRSMLSQGGGEDKGEDSLLEREMLDEIAKCQQEQEEKKRNTEEEQEEKKKKRKAKVFLVVTLQSNSSTDNSCLNAEASAENQANINSQEGGQGQSNSGKEQESGQSGERGGRDPGRGNGGGKKSDGEDEDGSQSGEESNRDEDSSSEKIIKNLSTFLMMGLLNAHSIMNKLPLISDLLDEYNLQVLFLTETWLKSNTGSKVLTKFFRDFKSFQQARETRGGGVAVLFSGVLEAQRIDSRSNTSLQYLVSLMYHETWDQHILTITLYHKPRYNVTELLEELQRLLDKFSNYKSIIVTGDFNIWIDDETKEPVRRFQQFLDDKGFCQHVEGPTFFPRKGQKADTLDLVISKNIKISDIRILDERVSDHCTILFSARPLSREEEEEEERTKRIKTN